MSLAREQYPPFQVGGEMIPPYLLELRDLLPPGPMILTEVPPGLHKSDVPPFPMLCDIAPPVGSIGEVIPPGSAKYRCSVAPPAGEMPLKFGDVVPPSGDLTCLMRGDEAVVPPDGDVRFQGSVPPPSGDGPLRMGVIAPPGGDIQFSAAPPTGDAPVRRYDIMPIDPNIQ